MIELRPRPKEVGKPLSGMALVRFVTVSESPKTYSVTPRCCSLCESNFFQRAVPLGQEHRLSLGPTVFNCSSWIMPFLDPYGIS